MSEEEWNRTSDGVRWKVTPDNEIVMDVDAKGNNFVNVWLRDADLSEMRTTIDESYKVPFGGVLD